MVRKDHWARLIFLAVKLILRTLMRFECAVLVAEQEVRLMIVQCGKSGQVYVCIHVRKMSEMAIIARKLCEVQCKCVF